MITWYSNKLICLGKGGQPGAVEQHCHGDLRHDLRSISGLTFLRGGPSPCKPRGQSLHSLRLWVAGAGGADRQGDCIFRPVPRAAGPVLRRVRGVRDRAGRILRNQSAYQGDCIGLCLIVCLWIFTQMRNLLFFLYIYKISEEWLTPESESYR